MNRIERLLTGAVAAVLVGSAVAAQSPAQSPAHAPAAADASEARYPVVPRPVRLEPAVGEFRLDAGTRIQVEDSGAAASAADATSAAAVARALAGLVAERAGRAVAVGTAPGTIVLRIDSTVTSSAEGYHLVVSPVRVVLSARAPAGLFYGVQTLRQLMTGDARSGVTIPAVTIDDAPRFAYRGMHLDVSRHFFPVEFVKRYIDLLAAYKLNRLHWHLTDDQGWRIEIERYPRLTTVGAYRDETVIGHAAWDVPHTFDGERYGGYYTQAEIRDVVAYATSRHVTIVPEIEMPGHARAAVAAYPGLACTAGPFDVMTVWGISEDIFCPSEETFTFLENVLAEVMALFPGEYIHIGGDEAPKQRWEESALAQEIIRREGLADEHALQGWFVQRIERFLAQHGRRLIGWDEIVEGGASPTAAVMYWRDWALLPGPDSVPVSVAKLAAGRGHDLVMTPNRTLYFDHWQADPLGEPLAFGGYSTLRHVYDYEPVPPDFSPAEVARILGAQANLWTEYITTPAHAEYMLLPRMLALAEVVWSPRAARDWDSFRQRVPAQLRLLDEAGINYRAPDARTLAPDPLPADTASLRIIGYLASWGVRSKGTRIDYIAADRLTHLFYAFGQVTEEGVAALGDPCLDTGVCAAGESHPVTPEGGNFAALHAMKARYPHLQLFISLGGWGGSRWFSDAAATEAGRRRLVASTIDVFLRAHPGLFDGIDVDWEFPVAGGLPGNTRRPQDRENFTLLLEEYRRQLDALGTADGRRYSLSIAASARPGEIANLELARLARVLDFINVMTFDYHTDGTIAHFNAPLYAAEGDPTPGLNIDASVRAYRAAGVPADRLVIAAPFYARGVGRVAPQNDGLFQTGSGEAAGDVRTIDWRALARRRPADHGFRRHWVETAQVPWLYNPDTRVFISYDGPDGIAAKADYVRANGLGGMMVWELGADNGTLLRVLHERLRRPARR